MREGERKRKEKGEEGEGHRWKKRRNRPVVSSYSHTVGPAMWEDLPKSFRYSSRLSRLLSRNRHLDDDHESVPSGSFLEQREDFVGFLVCLLLPYSKRAATSYSGRIKRNLERERQSRNIAKCRTLSSELLAWLDIIIPIPKINPRAILSDLIRFVMSFVLGKSLLKRLFIAYSKNYSKSLTFRKHNLRDLNGGKPMHNFPAAYAIRLATRRLSVIFTPASKRPWPNAPVKCASRALLFLFAVRSCAYCVQLGEGDAHSDKNTW